MSARVPKLIILDLVQLAQSWVILASDNFKLLDIVPATPEQ